MANGHGGKRENSGRKPRSKVLSNYEEAMKILDDNIKTALGVLIDIMVDEVADKRDRLRASEILLKKALPDMKQIKHEGGLSPIQLLINKIDEAVKKKK